jgi:O-antigen ligase
LVPTNSPTPGSWKPHTPWLGTHNSYTQISSECGIPALIFYAAVIVFCLRSNFRLYLRTRDRPAHRELAALSRCLLAGTCVYAVSAFFFHMAYSADLPLLAGFTVALQLVPGVGQPQRFHAHRLAAAGDGN